MLEEIRGNADEVWEAEPGGRLKREYEQAFLGLLRELYRNDMFWEDIQLKNAFFQRVESRDGETVLRAGIFDTDRIDVFSRPRAGREPDAWLRHFQNVPHAPWVDIRSRRAGQLLGNAEEAMLAALEHKRFLQFHHAQSALLPRTLNPPTRPQLRLDLLREYFSNYRALQDRTSLSQARPSRLQTKELTALEPRRRAA